MTRGKGGILHRSRRFEPSRQDVGECRINERGVTMHSRLMLKLNDPSVKHGAPKKLTNGEMMANYNSMLGKSVSRRFASATCQNAGLDPSTHDMQRLPFSREQSPRDPGRFPRSRHSSCVCFVIVIITQSLPSCTGRTLVGRRPTAQRDAGLGAGSRTDCTLRHLLLVLADDSQTFRRRTSAEHAGETNALRRR
jgi:hypothetical protein